MRILRPGRHPISAAESVFVNLDIFRANFFLNALVMLLLLGNIMQLGMSCTQQHVIPKSGYAAWPPLETDSVSEVTRTFAAVNA
jgi:hypothetical protein